MYNKCLNGLLFDVYCDCYSSVVLSTLGCIVKKNIKIEFKDIFKVIIGRKELVVDILIINLLTTTLY